MQAKILTFLPLCYLIELVKDLLQLLLPPIMVLRRENDIPIMIRILHHPYLRFESNYMYPGFITITVLFINDVLEKERNITCCIKSDSKFNRSCDTKLLTDNTAL